MCSVYSLRTTKEGSIQTSKPPPKTIMYISNINDNDTPSDADTVWLEGNSEPMEIFRKMVKCQMN